MNVAATLTPEQSLARLRSLIGQEHVDLRGGTVVAAPADANQIAELLRFANANGFTVTPTGGGTKLHWGNAVASEIQLSLERLRLLHEHVWQDMTCTVEAGCTWAAMQGELARHGQMVALDPLWPDRATVGGIVACNDSGALRLKFGGLRDLIIGMTIVLADGTVAKTGGKVVKNVAGYDLHKLMTGSFGTLAVITEVNFRLHPVEEHEQSWTITARDAAVADAAVFAEPLRALMDSQMIPSCVQLRTSNRECALDIRIAAVPECLREHAARIQDLFAGFAINESDKAVWQARQQLFDSNDAFLLKISLLPAELCAITTELQQAAAAVATDIKTAGQATGLMTVALNASPGAALALIERLRARVTGSGGSVVVLRLPDSMREGFDVWGVNSGALPLMREIKRRFDPGRTLNPGRFVGGI